MLVLIASIVLGVGGWLILVGLAPAKPTLTQLVTASQNPVAASTAPVPPAVSGPWSVRYGARATGLLESFRFGSFAGVRHADMR